MEIKGATISSHKLDEVNSLSYYSFFATTLEYRFEVFHMSTKLLLAIGFSLFFLCSCNINFSRFCSLNEYSVGTPIFYL